MFKSRKNSNGFSLTELVIILLVVLVLFFSGWFIYNNHKSTRAVVDSSKTELVVTRNNPLHQPGVNDFTKTVSHTSAVIIIDDIRSLKALPGGPDRAYSCPLDDGVDYILTFSMPYLYANADATGCQSIIVNSKTYLTTAKFWADVANATGQPVDPDTSLQ